MPLPAGHTEVPVGLGPIAGAADVGFEKPPRTKD